MKQAFISPVPICCLVENNFNAAKADYDKAVAVDPENYVPYRERGLFLAHNSST